MIAPMGRFAKFWVWVVPVAMMLLATAAYATWEEVEGPTYARERLRSVEIDGVHLGMRREEAAAALAVRGYRFENPSGVEGSGSFRSADGKADISIGYSEGAGVPQVESFTYRRAYTFEEVRDLEARRAELLAMFGRPTHWTRWVQEDGAIGDRLRYVSDRALLEDIDEASFCYSDWRCRTIVLQRDCRPYVQRVRGAVVSASFIYRGIYIEVDDYGRRSAQLRRDPAFRARDVGDTYCHVPYIH